MHRGTGTFLSVDPVESEPPYLYTGGNPINAIDSSGLTPDPSDPWDNAWCDTWWYPKKVSCNLITNKSIPYRLRVFEIWSVYGIVAGGQWSQGFNIGSKILRSYLDPWTTEVTFEGSSWNLGEWLRNQPNDDTMIRWHNRQVNDFFEQAILPALETCYSGPVRWRANGSGDGADHPIPSKLTNTEGVYPAIKFPTIFNERGFSLGKYFLKGEFIAENIQENGGSVTADITINREIDDEFRFDDGDTGDIPLHVRYPTFPNPGIGHLPHVWLVELQNAGMASNVNVHMRWQEKFHFDSRN